MSLHILQRCGERDEGGEGEGSVSLKKRRGDKKGEGGGGGGEGGREGWEACKSGIAARHAAWRVSALIGNRRVAEGRGGEGRGGERWVYVNFLSVLGRVY